LVDKVKSTPDFTPPDYIPREVEEHYQQICRHLWSGGRFHETDALLVGQYVLAHYEAGVARDCYATEGMLVETTAGQKAHPMIAVSNQCRTTAAKLAATLGLGPMHRHRMAQTIEQAAPSKATATGWHAAARGGK
jgi:P27 family predicted phage terminase small subunit